VNTKEASEMMTLQQLWDLLLRVRRLSFVARSASQTGWNGRGVGTVEVRPGGDGVITFAEQGTWLPDGREQEIRFRNVYRWTRAGDLLRLEHLRFGDDNPVYLFDLTQAGELEWQPASPHLCREDCYSAVLLVREDDLLLRWSIAGPRKSETIEYVYSWQGTEP
jgi:hypothetical protein